MCVSEAPVIYTERDFARHTRHTRLQILQCFFVFFALRPQREVLERHVSVTRDPRMNRGRCSYACVFFMSRLDMVSAPDGSTGCVDFKVLIVSLHSRVKCDLRLIDAPRIIVGDVTVFAAPAIKVNLLLSRMTR